MVEGQEGFRASMAPSASLLYAQTKIVETLSLSDRRCSKDQGPPGPATSSQIFA